MSDKEIVITKESLKEIRQYLGLGQADFIKELNEFHNAEIIRNTSKASYMNLSHIEKGNVDLSPRMAKPIQEFLAAKHNEAYRHFVLREGNILTLNDTPTLSNENEITNIEARIYLGVATHEIRKFEKEGLLTRTTGKGKIRYRRMDIENLKEKLQKGVSA